MSEPVTPLPEQANFSAQSPVVAPADTPAQKTSVNWWHEIRGLLWLLLMVLGIHSLIAKPFYIPSISMMPTMLVGDQLVVSKYAYGWSYASPSFDILPKMKGRIWGSYPARGDVVIIDHPVTGEEYIKRVIGLPGDRLSIRDGAVSINGVPIERAQQPDLELVDDPKSECDEFPGRNSTNAAGQAICVLPVVRETLPNGVTYDTIEDGAGGLDNIMDQATGADSITIPAGHVFLMGDNRDRSADSRATFEQKGLGGPVPIENIGGRAEFISFSTNGTASVWNPISWFQALRTERAGTSLRPAIRVKAPAGAAPAGAIPAKTP